MARRIALHAFAIGVLAACAGVARADETVSSEAYLAAAEHGLDPVEVQGASNSVGTDPWSYVRWLVPKPIVSSLAIARVRLTYYVEGGVTYSGQQTRPGTTACSWNWPIGTRFRFPNGEVFTCIDRGHLGSSGWLDLWRRPDLARLYGSYVVVEVLA